MTLSLYHYTCSAGLAGIRRSDWTLRPHLCPVGGPSLIWFTDLAEPDTAALGLASHSIGCDRTEHRLTVHPAASIVPWWRWCRSAGITRAQRDLLEFAPGAQPLRWWVSPEPVKATLA